MTSDNDGRRDFDFHMRPARIHNRRLARRLEGCTEWGEFEATGDAQPVVGGLGNIDFFHGRDFPGGPLEGMSLRTFDPRTRLWSIYWLDDRCCALQPAVVGRFEGGRGEFFGDDTFAGKADPGALHLERHHRDVGALGAGLLDRQRRHLGDQLADVFPVRVTRRL